MNGVLASNEFIAIVQSSVREPSHCVGESSSLVASRMRSVVKNPLTKLFLIAIASLFENYQIQLGGNEIKSDEDF